MHLSVHVISLLFALHAPGLHKPTPSKILSVTITIYYIVIQNRKKILDDI